MLGDFGSRFSSEFRVCSGFLGFGIWGFRSGRIEGLRVYGLHGSRSCGVELQCSSWGTWRPIWLTGIEVARHLGLERGSYRTCWI